MPLKIRLSGVIPASTTNPATSSVDGSSHRVIYLLSRPSEPGHHDHHLQRSSGPQRSRDADTGVREQPTRHGPEQQHQRRPDPAVPLRVLESEQLHITEQVAVDARQDHAREGVVPERPAGHGLAARLEGHERDRHQDVPPDVVLAVAPRAEGDDGGGRDAQGRLDREAGYEGGAPLGAKVAVEAAEEEGPDAEAA